jgi:hypothetical protein
VFFKYSTRTSTLYCRCTGYLVNVFCLGRVYYTVYTVQKYIWAFLGGGGQIDMIRHNNRALFIIITLTDGQTDGLDSASDRLHCIDRRLGMCSRGGSFSQFRQLSPLAT